MIVLYSSPILLLNEREEPTKNPLPIDSNNVRKLRPALFTIAVPAPGEREARLGGTRTKEIGDFSVSLARVIVYEGPGWGEGLVPRAIGGWAWGKVRATCRAETPQVRSRYLREGILLRKCFLSEKNNSVATKHLHPLILSRRAKRCVELWVAYFYLLYC